MAPNVDLRNTILYYKNNLYVDYNAEKAQTKIFSRFLENITSAI